MLSSKSFIVLVSYIWIFYIFLINFYVWHKVRVKLYSFAGKHPVATAPFVEKAILCPLNGLGTLVENQLIKDTWFYLTSQFYFFDLYVYPYVSTIPLSYVLKSENVSPPNLFFFHKIVLAFQIPCNFR